MSVSQFLEGLPCYNENNFTKFHVDHSNRSPLQRPSIYVPTKDYPSEQIIVTEKTSILLKYMQQHWDKKYNTKKRDLSPQPHESLRKRQRTEYARENSRDNIRGINDF
ncbi:DET1- and DDB1-associated protein 1 [Gonioctena quinquepunctata]|nr:DET1- and DDB1-associated protein 1 [Gonioctena quinquepunctata]